MLFCPPPSKKFRSKFIIAIAKNQKGIKVLRELDIRIFNKFYS